MHWKNKEMEKDEEEWPPTPHLALSTLKEKKQLRPCASQKHKTLVTEAESAPVLPVTIMWVAIKHTSFL